MYPNVRAAGCGLVGAGGVLGLCPRGSGFRACCMNSYSTIRIKQCYKFVLYNLYNNCIQKLVKKRFASRLGFQPGTKMACNCRSAIHHPTSYISAHFIYIPYNKNTIQKSGLYDFVRMSYSQSLPYNKITIQKTRLYKFIRVSYSHPLPCRTRKCVSVSGHR